MPTTTALQVPPEALLPASQPPSLLPFHLGYSGPAPVSTYFLPRPAPVDPHAPRSEPLLLSTFRGRQVVGQSLKVPEGYTGVVLGVPPPPAASALSSRTGASFDPAALFTTPDVEPEAPADEATDGRTSSLRRSPRKRVTTASAGARPPPAKKARVVAAKKFQLDSDSESEGEGDTTASAAPVVKGEDEDEQDAEATPSLVSALTTPSLSSASALTPVGSVADEEAAAAAVVVMTAELEPAADGGQEALEIVEAVTLPVEVEAAAEAVAAPPKERSPTPVVEDEPMEAVADEPYTSDQLLPTSASAGAPVRLLTPLSTFETIALWTADDPVDKGRDELYRCLGQGGWLEMSHVLHGEDEDE